MVNQPIRILVVEDDRSIRSALQIALKNQGYDVDARGDGCGVGPAFQAAPSDLAILDVGLPGGPDGYSVARELRRQSDVPVLFLTAADTLEARLEGFEAGADDYLVKPFSMAELVARVQALLRRSGLGDSLVLRRSDLVIDGTARTVIRAGHPLELTRTEYDLLVALARQAGRVLSKVQLLTQVWGFDAYDANLVEVHLSALRRKLEAHGPRLLHTVRGMGYVMRE